MRNLPYNAVRISGSTSLSPRVRGNRTPSACERRHRGSIPACAGEPNISGPFIVQRRVYPRVCGGTIETGSENRRRQGLSPRVRGNPMSFGPVDELQRSIPACAGEPQGIVYVRNDVGVYPRVCGGTPCHLPDPPGVSGLSPRVRGNRGGPVRRSGLSGSIPACAGEPNFFFDDGEIYRVYPRVCGGTVGSKRPGQSAKGLSPRVRGNPLSPSGPPRSIGSIPACAGEPYPCSLLYSLD